MTGRYSSAEQQAEILKDKGNLYFKKERLAAAIEAYTEAITLCPNVPTYWTNRALCHKKRNDWERVESDCRKAMELDRSSLKARYLLGLALLQSKQFGEGIKQLEKALELARGGSNQDMVEVIWQELAKGKYTEWEQVAFPRLQKQKELREFCEKALVEDLNHTLDAEDPDVYEVDRMDTDASVADDNERASRIIKLKNAYVDRKQCLAEVFNKAAKCDTPAEVPEYFCCKITMDILRDPVITPSGVTYERAVLLDHLEKVGKFDPLTRAPLEPEQLVSNLGLKEALKVYLDEHGWAYKI